MLIPPRPFDFDIVGPSFTGCAQWVSFDGFKDVKLTRAVYPDKTVIRGDRFIFGTFLIFLTLPPFPLGARPFSILSSPVA